MSDPIAAFEAECEERIRRNAVDALLRATAREFVRTSIAARYSYNFQCLGRPIIQYPQDIVGIQELIWAVRPDLIVETGIAHGGSLVLSASMLALLDYCDASASGTALNVRASARRVIGVDIEIRPHNRLAIENHPLAHKIELIEGSSVAQDVIAEVHRRAAGHERVMVLLDSNHTHDHVLRELRAYAPIVSRGSYCVVFDTIIENLPAEAYPDRPWSPGSNPMTAVGTFLAEIAAAPSSVGDGAPLQFLVDRDMDARLLVSAAPGGYLRRV
jgi:cephalosporin hydroxylase